MKHMKKMFALMLAVIMTLAMSVTAFAADEAKITITKGENDKAEHIYEAYQIFKGKVEDGELSEIEWGTNGSDALGQALADAFKDCTSVTTKEDAEGNKMTVGQVFAKAKEVGTAAAYAEAIGLLTESEMETLTDTINTNKTGNATEGDDTGVEGLEPGYYLVKDKDDSLAGKENGAYTKFILKLLGEDIEVKEKAEVPTVEKEVQDETDDAEAGADEDGYGKSADHAINETFNFRLTATIPADVNIANYDKYKIVFTDTMSAGVTFEEIESVTVNGTAIGNTDYESTATAGTAGGSFTITIEDLKQLVTLDGDQEEDIKVVVVYKAHLNKDAVIRGESGDAVVDNNNKIKLEYSNNADAYGNGETGETPEETVFVFTYDVENTKYADKISDTTKLPGAGFTLKDSDGNAVELIWDAALSAYRPFGKDDAAADKVTEMFSQEDGTFNIKGVDAGTYTLVETTVPAGYNKCEDITITITSTHERNSAKTDAKVELVKDNTENDIVDKSGSTLPETGGIGTTMFYVIGAILVIGAGVVLVTRRRMSA